MTNRLKSDEKYSKTRSLTIDKYEMDNNDECKPESLLSSSKGENRCGKSGLRTKKYFEKNYDEEAFISIITAVYNGEKYIEETILSIINQTYKNIEYIIIDGGSTDGTVNIIRKYEDEITYWISEKDNGISDAFNKGVKVAKGEYLNFQGDGDGFVSSDSLEKVFQDIDSKKDILVSARIKRIDISGNELFISKYSAKFDHKSLLFRMSMPHQGLFTHKNYFKKYGLFDVSNTFSMDYEHLLRSYHQFPKVVTKDIVVSRWRDDGLGNGRTLEIFKEYDKIKRANKVASDFVLTVVNYWILFKYHLKKVLKLWN